LTIPFVREVKIDLRNSDGSFSFRANREKLSFFLWKQVDYSICSWSENRFKKFWWKLQLPRRILYYLNDQNSFLNKWN